MNKQTLEKAKEQKEAQVVALMSEIEELYKQIDAIENGPVSAEMYIINTFGIGYQECMEKEFTFDWPDMVRTFKAGEENDRKRTQPLIDAVKEEAGQYKCDYVGQLTPLFEALKTLD